MTVAAAAAAAAGGDGLQSSQQPQTIVLLFMPRSAAQAMHAQSYAMGGGRMVSSSPSAALEGRWPRIRPTADPFVFPRYVSSFARAPSRAPISEWNDKRMPGARAEDAIGRDRMVSHV